MCLPWVRYIHSIHCLYIYSFTPSPTLRQLTVLDLASCFQHISQVATCDKPHIKPYSGTIVWAQQTWLTHWLLGSISFHPESPNCQKEQVVYTFELPLSQTRCLCSMLPVSPHPHCLPHHLAISADSPLKVLWRANGPGTASREMQKDLGIPGGCYSPAGTGRMHRNHAGPNIVGHFCAGSKVTRKTGMSEFPPDSWASLFGVSWGKGMGGGERIWNFLIDPICPKGTIFKEKETIIFRCQM